jgi:hypothetical protein
MGTALLSSLLFIANMLHEAGIKEFFKKHFTPKREKKDKSASEAPAPTETETPAAPETTPATEPTPTTAPATAEPTSTADAQVDGGEAKRAEADVTDDGPDGELSVWVRFIRRFSDTNTEAVLVTDSSATAGAPKAAEPAGTADDAPATMTEPTATTGPAAPTEPTAPTETISTTEPTATAPIAEGMTATSGPLEDAPSAEATK